MRILKLSFVTVSGVLLDGYRAENGCEFWDALREKISAAFGGVRTEMVGSGRISRELYLPSDLDEERATVVVHGVLEAMLEDDCRNRICGSAATATAKDLKFLNATVEGLGEDPDFRAAMAEASSEEDKEDKAETASSAVLAQMRRLSAMRGAGDPDAPKDGPKRGDGGGVPKSEPKTESAGGESMPDSGSKSDDGKTAAGGEPLTLSGEAEKIRRLKAALLAKVRGQRHAVDEVVQTIFECEMFSSHNPNRKGPLATFLFTGPSGVGKTFLAEQCGIELGREMLVVDMSEYSDNLANAKFNGDHGQPAVVTGFVRKHPNGIIVFDEVEKAHINTIHLFLQILDAGRLMDHHVKREISFRDTIVIMTTNAGKKLYDDVGVSDLSGTPRSVILEALRTDVNPQTSEPYFPECITTRMANGHVILFNHLEPFALMEIVRDELALQLGLFERSSGVKVEYDPKLLSALVLYHGGGVSDARTLRGLARNIAVRELQEIVMQIYLKTPKSVDTLKNVILSVDISEEESVANLFASRDPMYVGVFARGVTDHFSRVGERQNTVFEVIGDRDLFKRRVRGVTDYVLIDPTCGATDSARVPNDIEDVDSEGMRMFRYVREFAPEVPVYVLDVAPEAGRSFDTLLARGARGVVRLDPADGEGFERVLEVLSFEALINNAVYSLGRSGKFLSFNCAQYLTDGAHATVSFEKLQLRSAPVAGDRSLIAGKDGNNGLTFKDVIGCKAAKETLLEYCEALDNPRQTLLSGKRMPKGVLFYGPPGTGKTMLAKAMANECSATFFPVSATSFFGSLVGETERNVREIFRKARKYAPSVIFVDEVDAIGRKRVGSPSTAHNEDALNTFLAEMDGFVTDEKRPVFILAATNYSLEGNDGRVLDAAFVRRFDSKIYIPLPDTDDRYALLKACLAKHGIHFGEDHEAILRNMAERTGGMSNADLEAMNAQFVRALGDGTPSGAQYLDALDAFRFGEVNRMDPTRLRQTACHEAGHAILHRLCGSTPSFLTVVSRGTYGGFMELAGEEERGTRTFGQLKDRICCLLAGRAAEVELYGTEEGINTGASSDIQHARYLVRSAFGDYAMGEKLFSDPGEPDSEALMQEQYRRAGELLHEHRGTLERLSELLVEKKSLDRTQMEAFFASAGI